MRSLAVACSLLVVCSAAVLKDVKKPISNEPPTAARPEVETFHCSPRGSVAVINEESLPVYHCRSNDESFILAAQGHAQPHLDVTLVREEVKSLSDDYVVRTAVKRQKRQWGGGGFGGGFSGAQANAGAFGSGFGGGGSPFLGGGPLGGGGGFGTSQASSFANSGAGGFGSFGGFGR